MKFITTISRIFSTKSMYVFQEINIFIKLISKFSNNTKMLVFYECTYHRNSAKFPTKKKVRNIYATIASWINVAHFFSFFQGLFWKFFLLRFALFLLFPLVKKQIICYLRRGLRLFFLPNVPGATFIPDSRAGELWQKVANRGKIRWRHRERVGQIEFYLQNKALPKCSALGNFNRS